MARHRTAWILILAIVVLAGCFAKVRDVPTLTAGPAFEPLPDANSGLLVGLAISGGGSRAAAFAVGALEALAEIPVERSGIKRSALEQVQYISSVSGGSLAAGYFVARKPPKLEPVLAGAALSPAYAAFFREYRGAMLEDFELAAAGRQLLFFRAFNPTKLAYSLAEVWDTRFFHGMTFAELHAREKAGDSPRLLLNGMSYNSGRRFVFTTLPAADFEYDFAGLLLGDLMQRQQQRMTPEGAAIIRGNLEAAKQQFLPLTFEQIGADHRTLPLSLAVVSSASFPPVVGPVTYRVGGKVPYHHVGDGGLFDNLGTESLTTLFLKKIPRGSSTRALIIVIDAAFPFTAGQPGLDGNPQGFEVFKNDPSRIVGIMEERANAYQLMLWDALRTEGVVLPDFASLRVEVLRHTEAEWAGYQDLPAECRDEFPRDVTTADITRHVAQIPTLFRITPCNGALAMKAAHKVVGKHRARIVESLARAR